MQRGSPAPGFSISKGLFPSRLAAIATPLRFSSLCEISISDGLSTPLSPFSLHFIYPKLRSRSKTIFVKFLKSYTINVDLLQTVALYQPYVPVP